MYRTRRRGYDVSNALGISTARRVLVGGEASHSLIERGTAVLYPVVIRREQHRWHARSQKKSTVDRGEGSIPNRRKTCYCTATEIQGTFESLSYGCACFRASTAEDEVKNGGLGRDNPVIYVERG